MKIFTCLLALVAILGFSGCGNFFSSTHSTHNEWTWMTGSVTVNQAGVYGTKGTASSSNTPGARVNPVSWTDKSGNFWLFGGNSTPGPTQDNYFNDLWKYSNGQWTWMSGSNTYNQVGVYGTKGTAAPSNVPGARSQAVGWTDSSGNLWLFGGLGLDSTGKSRLLNDLWMYSNNEWTWMGGSNVGQQPGIYGTQGTASPTNIPGARSLALSWTDSSGNFWLFGGGGYDSAGTDDYLNDLWKYSGGQWTWVSGSDLVDQIGSYGTLGTASPTNVPGARFEAGGWTDSSGNLFLFGGSIGPDPLFSPISDLWKFSSGEWTWVAGPNTKDQNGVYGTEGTPSAANTPGSRVASATWIDSSGNLWLFGGDGYDSVGSVSALNDLWKYNAGEWTWVNGSNLVNAAGAYGTEGTAAPTNEPGARFSGGSWIDSSGNLWLFGGDGFDSAGTLGLLNDLWRYQP